jgi:hypothetical protein
LRTGETYEGIVNDILAGLAMANSSMLADPIYAGLVSVTTDVEMEYPIGTEKTMEVHTEYTRPIPQRGKTTGGMLAIEKFDHAFGWTWDFLKEARRVQIDNDVALGIKALQNNFHKKILTRLFKSTYTTVASGRSMPLADGGTADSVYVPLQNPERAAAFLYTHDHIEDYDGITQANLELAILHLWEHGYDPPYDVLAAQADYASWTNVTTMTGYVPPANALIRYGSSTNLASVGNWGVISTKFGVVRLNFTARIPTGFWTAYTSFGANDPRNPIVVRYDDLYGMGAILLRGDHIREYPLEGAILFHTFGANIADRVGAIVVQNTSGSYADPTIV